VNKSQAHPEQKQPVNHMVSPHGPTHSSSSWRIRSSSIKWHERPSNHWPCLFGSSTTLYHETPRDI